MKASEDEVSSWVDVKVKAGNWKRKRRAFELERRRESVGGRRRKKEGCLGAEKVRYGHVW